MLPILLLLLAADDKPWKAGVAVRVITPPNTMWMAGYASRKSPAEGKEHDLYVKALAIEDPSGNRVVVLTSDLIGIPRSLALRVRSEAKKRFKIDDSQLMLSSSHTHCGPVVADNLIDMYPMPPEEARKVGPYTIRLAGWMNEAIAEAINKLSPARFSSGIGKATFAVNRREATTMGIINGRNPGGPVDHDVPVLRVSSLDGKLIAAVFGYACHNTTLPYLKWCGDYAGFAQEIFEAKHSGAIAMFWAGCGGDANPLPRGKVDLAKRYGKQLCEAVDNIILGKMVAIQGVLSTRYCEIALPYDKLPSKEQISASLLSKNLAERKRAERLSEAFKGRGIDTEYKYYPVQVLKIGNVTWVALGGEVVVDYSLRLKRELGADLWVAAYTNDVMAYVGSRRILKEGGYEADSSVVYYGLPARWSPQIEDHIVDTVKALAK